MNIPNVEKTRAAIEAAEPARFRMHYFFERAGNVVHTTEDFCSTAGCVGGWALIACGVKELDQNRVMLPGGTRWQTLNDAAQEVLGLTYWTAGALFHMDGVTPLEMRRRCGRLVKDLGALERIEEEDVVRVVFDKLPAVVRRDAAVRVLSCLLVTEQVHWLRSIEQAIDKYLGVNQ